MKIETFKYDNSIVRAFSIASVVFGIVGIPSGRDLAAAAHQRGDLRLRGQRHFHGRVLLLQRLCKGPDVQRPAELDPLLGLAAHHRQAALTLPLRLHHQQGIRRAEWPIDIAITLVWVVFGINMFGTISSGAKSTCMWPSGSTSPPSITVAVLHIVNSLELPARLFKSYSSMPACRTRWCSGGMATTPWRSS
jgi:cytochrome c oxidase cbb3-type subunit I/II